MLFCTAIVEVHPGSVTEELGPIRASFHFPSWYSFPSFWKTNSLMLSSLFKLFYCKGDYNFLLWEELAHSCAILHYPTACCDLDEIDWKHYKARWFQYCTDQQTGSPGYSYLMRFTLFVCLHYFPMHFYHLPVTPEVGWWRESILPKPFFPGASQEKNYISLRKPNNIGVV